MKSFGHFVARHPKAIIIVCLLCLIPAYFGMVSTKINYDIFTYLPKDLNSTQGQDILQNDFRVAGNAFLMMDRTNDWEVLRLKQRIETVPGVEKVIWINDWVDLTVPRQFVPDKLKDQFYKGDSTLLQIQFQEGPGSERTVAAINEIQSILDHNAHLGGVSAVIAGMRGLIEHERLLYLAAGVLLSLIVLSLTLSSTIIPILFLCSIGAAILYNLGTNMFLGRISYVTSAITAVLQLGVTMDFSIFLMHRYLEEKEKYPTPEDAMAEAIHRTFLAIGASSLTAIAGFLALSVMQIGLGKDMGIVMAKGVAFGVIISLTLLPALIVCFDGLISRYQHRVFLPSFNGIATLVTKRYIILAVLFVALLVPAYYGRQHVKVFYNVADALPQKMQSILDTKYIKERFGNSDTMYLIMPSGHKWEQKNLAAEIRKFPGVVSVLTPADMADTAIPDEYLPENVRDSFSNGTYDYMVIQSSVPPADKDAGRLISRIRNAADIRFNTYYLSGESVLTDDLIKLTKEDSKKVDLWSVGAILAILALAFTSLSLPIILVAVIELAILINMAIPFYMNDSIPFIALLSVGAIQLGSTVNYAILMVSRFKEELACNDKFTAAQHAVRGTGKAVVTSALTLCFATIGVGMITQIDMIGSLTTMIARGAIVSVLCILLFLPALLLVFEDAVNATTLRWRAGKAND